MAGNDENKLNGDSEFAPKGQTRAEIVGDDEGPSDPFPVRIEGKVEHGFGRGSRELGCPTANLPARLVDDQPALERNGVYFGWASLKPAEGESRSVQPMVMSVGFNPVYANKSRTLEVHIIHEFPNDFYDQHLKVIILCYIRPEYNYPSTQELIKDIELDKSVTIKSLSRPTYQSFSNDPFFFSPSS